MSESHDTDMINRLRSVAGHVNGITRMLEEGAYCIDVIQQIQAVQAALTKVNTRILDNHLHSCVLDAVRSDDPAEREKVLEEITQVFAASNKK